MKWPPKDGRAFIALLSQILGALAIGGFMIWQTLILTDNKLWSPSTQVMRLDTLGWSHITLVVGFVALFVGLGLSIGERTIKLSRDGFEASSEDDDDSQSV